MIRRAQFTWEKVEKGFLFQVRDGEHLIHPEQWSQFKLYLNNIHICVDPLFRDSNESKSPEIISLGLKCDDSFIATLTEQETQQLCLPKVSHARVKIMANGLISYPDFKLSYRLMSPEGRAMLGAKVDGILLKSRGETELLLEPIYSILNEIELFSSTPPIDRDERFSRWGVIKELLPEDAIVDGQLQNITICRADRVTLDVKDYGAINPLLIKPNSEKEWDIQGQSDVEYAVPKSRQVQFEDQFKRWSKVRSNYAIGNGQYVILPKRVQEVLGVIKDYQSKNYQERLAFISDPHKIINEALNSDTHPEDLDAIFIETPEFISQRIDSIGEWEPKICAYVVKRSGDWIPDESDFVSFSTGNLLVSFTIEEIRCLLLEVNQALDLGDSLLLFKDKIIEVSIETKNTLIRILSPIDEAIKEKKLGLPVMAPILKDNIEEVDFVLPKKSPRPIVDRLPSTLKTLNLYEHQEYGIDWLARHWESGSRGALLADDMGLGKTLQTLVFLASVRKLMDINAYSSKPFLIVAPSGLLKNWQTEVTIHIEEDGIGEIFEAYGEHVRKLEGLSVVERNQFFNSKGGVLTTYETLRDKYKYFISIDWGVIVFDEAQKIKNPDSRMTVVAKTVHSDFTIMLTGTPVENELKDLWCIIETANPGLFGKLSLKHFHEKYVLPAENDSLKAQRLKSLLVEETVPSLMLRRLKKDHLPSMPQKHIHLIPVDMPKPQAIEYENIVRSASLGGRGGVLQIIQKMRKASLIAEEFDGNGMTDGVVSRSARLTALMDILDQVKRVREKALIFCEYMDMQEYLSGYLQHKYQLAHRPRRINGAINGEMRKKYVEEFQGRPSNEFDVMLLSPKAGGVGLTITAANHVIHLTRWWNPAVEDQSTDRVFRIGQKREVNVYIPMAIHPKYKEGSFDANLNRLLEKKRDLSLNALMPGTITANEMEDLISQAVLE